LQQHSIFTQFDLVWRVHHIPLPSASCNRLKARQEVNSNMLLIQAPTAACGERLEAVQYC